MKHRINYIDIAKGFLILYLVVFHFRWGTMKAGINCNEYLYLLDYTKIISCFFMPAFFILSGYCSSFNTNFVNFAKKNTLHIFLPMVFFSLASYALGTLFYGKSFDYGKATYGQYINFWFLSSLYFSKFGLWCMIRYSLNTFVMILLSMLTMLSGAIWFYKTSEYNFLALNMALFSFPFVVMGYLLKHNQTAYKLLLRYSVVAYIVTFVLYLLLFKKIGIFVNMSIPWIYELPLYFILSVFGTFSLLFVSYKIRKNRILEFFGRNTLLFYCTHIVLFPYIVSVCFKYFYWDRTLMQFLICCILCFVTQLIVWLLCEHVFRYKPFKYLLGQF